MTPVFQTIKTALHGAAEVTVAGHSGVCDPSGALYLESDRILIVSDLHFEKGSSFARRGMMLPPYDTATTLAALAKIIARYNPTLRDKPRRQFSRWSSGSAPARTLCGGTRYIDGGARVDLDHRQS